MNPQAQLRTVRSGLLLLTLALATLGCKARSALPPTYPVTGTVKFKGGKPVAGGAIQFSPVKDAGYAVSGDLDNDGTFRLLTITNTEKVTGAPEGEYRVTIHLPIGADQKGGGAIPLPNSYRVEAKDNNFTIEVDPPPRR